MGDEHRGQGHGHAASSSAAEAVDEAVAAGRGAAAREAAAPQPLPHALGRRAARRATWASSVRVAGWVHRRRDHGGLIFIDLRDRTGLLQLVFRPEEAPEAHAAAGRPARRGRDHRRAASWCARRGRGQPRPADRRGRARGCRSSSCWPTPRRRRSRSTRTSRWARSCACATATSTCARSAMRDAMVLRHEVVATIRDHLSDERLPRDRDADPDPLDARGRARLPRAEPA